MFCKSCGKEIADNSTTCPNCGAPANQQSAYAAPAPAQKNTMAIAGLVLAFLAPLIGLILSCIGLKKSKELGGEGRKLAIAGIVISSLDVAAWIIVIAVIVIVVGGVLGAVSGAMIVL